MNKRILLGLITVLIVVACIPQLAARSIEEGPSPLTPLSETEDYASFLPLVYNLNILSPSPVPTSRPPTPSPTPSPTIEPTSPLPSPSPTAESTAPIGQSITANHFVVDQFDQIPDSAIQAATDKTVFFRHASVGGYISNLGLNCLQGTINGEACDYPEYYYDRSNWDWAIWDPTEYEFEGKIRQFEEQVVPSQHSNHEILGMKLCYVDWWMSDWREYRDMMLRLESNYPANTFLWTTQAIRTEWDPDIENWCGIVEDFNTNIRAYAQANNKPLYDIADIESHDLNGNACFVNGCESMCPEYGGPGHPNQTGSLQLAKGFWWLMARISGWDGQ